MSFLCKSALAAWRPVSALALVLGLCIPIFSPAAVSAQEKLPVTATASPENAILYHEVDLDFEGAQWQQTQELLARVGIPNALDLWREQLLTESSGSGEFTEADLDALIGGEMAVIVTPHAVDKLLQLHAMHQSDGAYAVDATPSATPMATGAEDGYGVAAVLLPGDPDAAWEYAQRQINAFAEQRDQQVETSTVGNAELIWTGASAQQENADAYSDGGGMDELFSGDGPQTIAAGRDGDFIIAGISVADVKMIADVIDGGTPSLAESEAAQGVMAQLPADAVSSTYINAQGIVQSLDAATLESLKSFMPANMPPETWGGAAGIALTAHPEGFRLDSIATFAEGVDMSAFQVPNDPAVVAQAGQVPAGTFLYAAGTLPPNSFASAAYSLSQAVNAASSDGTLSEAPPMMELPTPEQVKAEIATATKTLGFDPAADLFDLLGNKFLAFSSFPNFSQDGFGLDAVAAITTTDPVKLAETMKKVAAFADRADSSANISVRRIGDDTVYVAGDPESTDTPTAEFGVVGDQAVVAIGDGIRDLTTTPSASLADDAQYQTVMGMLPSEFYQVAYVDIGQAVGPLMMLTGQGESGGIPDADLACSDYPDQAAAQAALDSDPVANSNLDMDYDGVACSDAFGAAATPGAAAGSLENLRALATVSYQQGDSVGSSAILYIAEPGS